MNFGLKYNPPKLGVQYYMVDEPETHFVYEIPLAFFSKESSVESVTKELMDTHKFYLNPKIIKPGQIRRLLSKLLTNLPKVLENKENGSAFNNGAEPMGKGLAQRSKRQPL